MTSKLTTKCSVLNDDGYSINIARNHYPITFIIISIVANCHRGTFRLIDLSKLIPILTMETYLISYQISGKNRLCRGNFLHYKDQLEALDRCRKVQKRYLKARHKFHSHQYFYKKYGRFWI